MQFTAGGRTAGRNELQSAAWGVGELRLLSIRAAGCGDRMQAERTTASIRGGETAARATLESRIQCTCAIFIFGGRTESRAEREPPKIALQSGATVSGLKPRFWPQPAERPRNELCE